MSKILKSDYSNIASDYLAGDTLKVLADRYGVHHSAIEKILKKLNIKRRKQGNPQPVLVSKWTKNFKKNQELYWSMHGGDFQSHFSPPLNHDSFFASNSGDFAPEWVKILTKF